MQKKRKKRYLVTCEPEVPSAVVNSGATGDKAEKENSNDKKTAITNKIRKVFTCR